MAILARLTTFSTSAAGRLLIGTRLALVTAISVVLIALSIAPSIYAEPSSDSPPRVSIIGTEATDPTEIRTAVTEYVERIESSDGRAADVADLAYEIERHLRANGFASASVDYRMVALSEAGERVVVRTAARWNEVEIVEMLVHEGKKTYFGTFQFTGNNHFSSNELVEQVPIVSTIPGTAPVTFDEGRLRNAVNRISNKYILAGFADVEVGPVERTVRDEDQRVFIDVVIPIAEGARYTITDVGLRTDRVPRELERPLDDDLGIVGMVYFPRRAEIGASRIRTTLGRLGYRPRVEYESDLSTEGEARITYNVEIGRRRVFTSLRIRETDGEVLRTSTRLIRRAVPFQTGDPIDLIEIEQLESRLYELGTFALVDIEEVPLGDHETERGGPQPTRIDI